MTTDPAAIATAYFDAIRARDADAIAALFTSDGELFTAAGTFRGPTEIADFYSRLAFAFGDLEPHPGDPVVDGDRLAVEIRLRVGGRDSPVADFFTFTGDRISRLVIYSGPDLR